MTPRDARTARNVSSPTATSARTTAIVDDELTLSVAPPSVVVVTNDLVDDRNPSAATGGSAVSTAAIEVMMNKFNDLTTCAKIDTSTSVDDDSCAVPVLCRPIKLARVTRQLSVEDDASCDETAVNTSNEDNLDEIGVVLAADGDGGPPVNVGVVAPLLEHQAPSPRSRRDAPSDNAKSTRKCQDEEFCDIARMLSGDDGDTVRTGSSSQYTSLAEVRNKNDREWRLSHSMHSALKSVGRCWGQDDAPSPVCEAVSEKVMNISRSVSEESRIAFRSQADIVSEKSRARTPTRNNRQVSKYSDFPDYDGYQVQADTMASVESRSPVTLSKPNWDTTATGRPGDVASEKNEDKPSAASLETKAALNRRKIQKLKSLRSRQKRAQM